MASNEQIVAESITDMNNLIRGRTIFESHWEEVAELVLPAHRNTFTRGSYNSPGEKKTEKQVDSSAALALSRFGSIIDSLLTPRNMMWHMLTSDNEDLNKLREVRMWFEIVNRIMFKERYKPSANFASQNLASYISMGAFGNGVLWIDPLRDIYGGRGIRYSCIPLGEIYLGQNFQGLIDRFCRVFWLTKEQAIEQFGEENLPPAIMEAKNATDRFEFLHRVCPRLIYDPQRIDSKGKPFASYYIALGGGGFLISESGYNSFPISVNRYENAPGEIYARGPAMTILPSIKTINAQKRDFLVQGHRAASPVLLTTDDGMVDFSMRPGALNKGGWSSDGKPLVGTLPVGNIQVSEEMMAREVMIIDDAFLIGMFKILQDNPQMTATQVIEIVNQKGILLAPTVGRQQSEYLGPMIHREMDLQAEMGLLPPVPEVMREAQSEYQVVYTSPLSRAMRAQEVAGFGRTMEILTGIVNITQDPTPLDEFNFSKASRDIADIQAVPESWMASPEESQAKKDARQQAMDQQAEIQAAPAAAAMLKAKAVAEKGNAK